MRGFARFWLQCLRITVETVLHWEGLLGVLLPVALTIAATLGYDIEIVGGLYGIASALFLVRLVVVAPYQVAARRPDMFTERYNAPLGTAFRHLVFRFHFTEDELTSDDYAAAYRDLRQGAVNGDFAIWGRRHSAGYSDPTSIDRPPLTKIRPEYWQADGFDYLTLLTTGPDTTNNIDLANQHRSVEAYDDLQIDMHQVKRAWRKDNIVRRATRWIAHVKRKAFRAV